MGRWSLGRNGWRDGWPRDDESRARLGLTPRGSRARRAQRRRRQIDLLGRSDRALGRGRILTARGRATLLALAASLGALGSLAVPSGARDQREPVDLAAVFPETPPAQVAAATLIQP
ncbi:MAG: hypothetical protein KC560_14315, partial [Myxococcales bacterium]|nr:hypothetical protein [Myxococcales bacterium]